MSHHFRSKRQQAVPAGYWSPTQSYVLAVITLFLGIAVGYLARGSATTQTGGEASDVSAVTSNSGNSGVGRLQPSRSEVTARMVGSLLQQLRTQPNDADLLVGIGNIYYDDQEYAKSIEYYQKALKIRPEDVNVRTDMATAMWYTGNADGAIDQYEQSLKFQPTHAQTLFNMGIVTWQGKKDGKGAIQIWESLLASNPSYPDRPKVQQLLDRVKREVGSGS